MNQLPEKLDQNNRKKCFLNLCQTAKIPSKLAKEWFSEFDGKEQEGEYALLIQHLSEYMDTRVIEGLEIVRAIREFPGMGWASALMDNIGKRSHTKSVNNLYSTLIEDIDNYSSSQEYLIVSHLNTNKCAILGPVGSVKYMLELLEKENRFTTILFDTYEVEDENLIIALIPTKVLFCEIGVDE